MTRDPAETRDATFDPTKPFTTREGVQVEEFQIAKEGGTFPYRGKVRGIVRRWDALGSCSRMLEAYTGCDLVNTTPAPQPATDAGADGWRTIDSAPRDGTKVLLYRPLAAESNDPVYIIRRTTSSSRPMWKRTIPSGIENPQNFTEGSCYATHWRPLPPPPGAAPRPASDDVVAAEREACAQLLEDRANFERATGNQCAHPRGRQDTLLAAAVLKNAAAAIRARSAPPQAAPETPRAGDQPVPQTTRCSATYDDLYEARRTGFHLFKDGDMWCAVGPQFIDLGQSPAGFGKTHADAVADLLARDEARWRKSPYDPPKLNNFRIWPSLDLGRTGSPAGGEDDAAFVERYARYLGRAAPDRLIALARLGASRGVSEAAWTKAQIRDALIRYGTPFADSIVRSIEAARAAQELR